MRKSRFTDAQIVAILKELDAGRPAKDLARRHGVHANTMRLWKDRYGELETRTAAKTASSLASRWRLTP